MLVTHIQACGEAAFAAQVLQNNQRTWANQRAPLKAEAARNYAEILTSHGVATLADANELLAELDKLASTSPVKPARTKTATEEEPAEESDEGVEAVPETDAPGRRELARGAVGGRSPDRHRGSPLDLSDRRIPVFTLGVGLALVGLGIGFLGVRMRRR